MLVELERYEKAMEAANMTPETIQSYVDRAHRFVGGLDGDYKLSEHFDRPGTGTPSTEPRLNLVWPRLKSVSGGPRLRIGPELGDLGQRVAANRRVPALRLMALG